MRSFIIAGVAALAFASTASIAGTTGNGWTQTATKGPPVETYKLDAKGKCHAANGQFAKQSLCAAPAITYKLDANGRCHGPNGQFASANKCVGGVHGPGPAPGG